MRAYTPRELVKALEAQGWTDATGKKHRKLRSPDGRLLTCPMTGSDHRGMKNTVAQARRLGAEL